MTLTLQQIEAHLLGAANILRGKTAGQDYKNYILSARRCVTRSRTSIDKTKSLHFWKELVARCFAV